MKIMVIDGNSILNRAFYGIHLLTNHEGFPTNAIYGFLSTCFRLQDAECPDRTIVCFDVHEKTFRHERFPTYKATRKGMPDLLAAQLPVLKELLDALGIQRCECAGFEADDLLGTISRLANERGDTCLLVTGDRDSFQLIGGGTTVRFISSKLGQSTDEDYDETHFREVYGFEPARLVDLKALMGDASDNISGVPGVGEKTAMQLLHTFGSLEAVYAHIDDPAIKKGVRSKLQAGQQAAQDSFWLATIRRDVPLDLDLATLPDEFIDEQALYALLVRLEFPTFIQRFGLSSEDCAPLPAPLSIRRLTSLVEVNEVVTALAAAEQPVCAVCSVPADSLDAIALRTTDGAVFCSAADFSPAQWDELLSRLFDGSPDSPFPLSFVLHDAKPVVVALAQRGIRTQAIAFDTCLAAYLLDPTQSGYELGRVALGYLNREVPHVDWDALLLSGELDDVAQQLAAVCDLYARLPERLEAAGMHRLYYEIEHPLLYILADMQVIGCTVAPTPLRAFGETLDQRMQTLIQQIYQQAGEPFNLNSSQQLGTVLFQKLGLPVQKKTKTGYSTNAEVLDKLATAHPIVPLILEYRQLAKLKNTYVDGLLKVISPRDGRVHSHFQQTVTATGRLSSTDPNLQNIPVRTELGRELRRMFVAPDADHVLIDADYSQIELRLLAHIAQDTHMIEAFRAGQDIHAATAAKVYHVPLEEVTPPMRSSCKAVNFGIVYGISDFSLSEDIGVSREEAGAFIRSYLETYPGVATYMETMKQRAREQGYVSTLFGRRRAIPDIQNSKFAVRSAAERVAMNTPIQGTAADIIKIAMVRVCNRLAREGLQSRLILQIHDELILEAPKSEQERAMRLLTEEMEHAFVMDVPLVAEAKAGASWYEAK